MGVMVLINNAASFDFQKYSTVSENLRYYTKLDRSFFKLPVFAAQHVNMVDAKPPLLDPRVTISTYLNYLLKFYENPNNVQKTPKMNFDWADWVDVAQAELFIKAHPDLLKSVTDEQLKLLLTKFCYDEMLDQRDPWVDEELHGKHVFFDEQIKLIGICLAIWKKYFLQLPERVVFETDKKFFEIDVEERKSDLPHLEVPKSATREENYERAKKLLSEYEKNGGQLDDFHLPPKKTLEKDSFLWNPDKDLEDLKSKDNLSPSDQKYKDFLQYAKDHAEQDRFYFTFPGLRVDANAELHHYNFPFLRQIISHEERIAVIHHLVRSWFKVCENYGIVTWINYGNLIGWWFNAQNLPWDNDIDAQVLIQDLNRLGRELNNTLFVENPKNGNGLFWFQTNHVYLQQGTGNNFIDARFIDARTGIYIDILALWHTDHQPGENFDITPEMVKQDPDKNMLVHCKHLQFFALSDLFPLRRTIFEGAQAYIPRKVERILKRFYGNRPFESFKCFDHNYQADIGTWVPDEICRDPPTGLVSRFNDRGDITLAGACGNRDLQDQFNKAKDAIELHWREFRDFYKQNKEPDSLTQEDLPVFRDDPFEMYVKFEEEHGSRNYG